MNKRAYRLVFDRRRGMRVATAETVSATGKSASGEQRAGRRTLASVSSVGGVAAALLLGLGAASEVMAQYRSASPGALRAMSAATARANTVARTALPTRLGLTADQLLLDQGRFTVGDPTASGLDITQLDSKVLINWASFNIGQDMTVRFIQPGTSASAFNQIWDQDPSVIMGRIEANGEVILQNRNGFIFSPTARVNTASFVATALSLASKNFDKGWRNLKDYEADGAAFAAQEGDTEEQKQASIVLQSGMVDGVLTSAEIKTAAGGDVVIVAPNVYNGGQIEVNQGTATLAAGQAIYLQNSEDASQRGLIVTAKAGANAAAGLSGTVEHLNTIKAEQGRVNLVGMSVRQNGVVSATTAVKGKNGQIYLQAMETLSNDKADRLGRVEFGQGSVTEVTPSSNGATQKDSDTFYRSRIEVQGKDILVQSGARIEAVSGNVTLRAAESAGAHVFSPVNGSTDTDNSSLVVESGATISARGLRGVSVGMDRNQLGGRVFSIELADSPVQRGGVLYRRELLADARQAVSVANVTGLYNLTERSAQELSTRGGNITLLSQGALVVQDDVTLDVSGGSIRYEGGVISSSLVRRGNALIPIEKARADVAYDELYTAGDRLLVRNVAGFDQGVDAGRLQLGAPRAAVGKARLLGDTVVGAQQRNGSVDPEGTEQRYTSISGGATAFSDSSYEAPRELGRSTLLKNSPHLYTSLQPLSGQLVLGLQASPLSPVASALTLQAGGAPASVLGGAELASSGLSMPASLLADGGFGHLTGRGTAIVVEQGVRLDLGAHGGLDLKGGTVDFLGQVRSGGGQVSLSSTLGDLTVAQGAVIDVSGDMRDERAGLGGLKTVTADGGKINLNALGTVDVQAGSLLDVSAGALRQQSVDKGSAGSINIKVNDGINVALSEPEGRLRLGGELRGHGFDKGAALKVEGLFGLSLGAAPAGTDVRVLQLGSGFFNEGGFSKFDLKAIGDVTVQAGTVIQPLVTSWTLLPAKAVAGETTDVARLITQSDLKRPTVAINLTASQQPVPGVRESLLGQGSVNLKQNSKIDAGARGSVTLNAGRDIDVQGTLVARGGRVNLLIDGRRGHDSASTVSADDAGQVKGQAIRLREGSVIDVSGEVLSESTVTKTRTVTTGEVLAGGQVSLNTQTSDTAPRRGQVITEVGSTINLSGAAGVLNVGNPNVDAVRVSRGAGSLSVGGPDGWMLQGTVQASRPDATVGGASFDGSVSSLGWNTQVNTAGGAKAYATTDVGQIEVRATAVDLAAQQPMLGRGQVSAEMLLNSGFDRITLRADQAIALGAGVNLAATQSGQAPLRSVQLFSPVIKAADQGVHLIRATHVALGNQGIKLQPGQTTLPQPQAVLGDASLKIEAGLIEVTGQLGLQGFGQGPSDVSLLATLGSDQESGSRRDGEIRFIGREAADAGASLTGQFNFAGTLKLQAGQIYATTLSQVNVQGLAGASLITLAPQGGSTSATPLSALATLSLSASTIDHGGVIRQPFGAIQMTSESGVPTLGAGSELSVSGDGVTVPVGNLLNGSEWVYVSGTNGVASGINSDTARINLTTNPLDKGVGVKGKGLSISSQAILNAKAGGDLIASEFIPGVGGSQDTFLRPGVYAVVPNYTYDFAPHDASIAATQRKVGTRLSAGDQIEIVTDNGVLPKGTYTLLPAGYGVLPGAVLVSETTVKNVVKPLTKALKPSDDGSVIVSGHRTATGTQQSAGSDHRVALLLEPESTFRAKSTTEVTSINAFRRDVAERTGAALPTLPGDAGRISLAAQEAFNWQADLRLDGGLLDLSMGRMTLVDQVDATQPVLGQVSAQDLRDSGARSVLLGGTRQLTAAGTEVTTVAQSVTLTGNLSVGELIVAAQGAVTVADDTHITTTGSSQDRAESLVFKGTGAGLVVSENAGLEVSRQVADPLAARTGVTTVGARASLVGGAVSLDGSQAVMLDGTAAIAARSVDLGTDRIVVADDETVEKRTGTLKIGQALLAKLNQVERLKLRALTAIELAGSVKLGESTVGVPTLAQRLVLDAPTLVGTGTAADTVQLKARQVELRNTSGVALTPAQHTTGLSSLRVEANPLPQQGLRTGVLLGEGHQHLAFQQVDLKTTGDVVFDGQDAKVTAQGNVGIQSERVSATSGTVHSLSAGQALTLSGSRTDTTALPSHGVGARLALQGRQVVQSGVVDLASGHLSITAQGAAGQDAIVFAQGSRTDVSGRTIKAGAGWSSSTQGGSIQAQAKAGHILVNGLLDVSAGAQAPQSDAAKSAGRIQLQATQGLVKLDKDAALRGQASTASLSGQLVVDAQGLSRSADAASAQVAEGTLDRLAQLAKAGGLRREVNVRLRGEQDQSLNTELAAIRAIISADAGQLTLGEQARIQASAPQGGLIQVSARDDVVLKAGTMLDARSTREGANGGDVMIMSTQGVVQGAAVASIDASGDDALDGRVLLISDQDALLKLAAMPQDPAMPLGSTAQIKAGEVAVIGNRVHQGNAIDLDPLAISGLVRKDVVSTTKVDTTTKVTITGTGNNRLTVTTQTVVTTPTTTSQYHLWDEATQAFVLNTVSAPVTGAKTTTTKQLSSTKTVSTDKASTVTKTETVQTVVAGTPTSSVALTDIKTQADAFVAQADAVQQALGLSGVGQVRAGVEVRAQGDFNLTQPLSLQSVSSAGTPWFLTLRATGNLNIQSELSDGFASLGRVDTSSTLATLKPTKLSSGDAASFRLVAGADLSAAHTLATLQDAQADLVLGPKALVRTTSGSIELAAARHLQIQSDHTTANATTSSQGVVYVAGRAVTLQDTETVSEASAYANKWASFTHHGGRLEVTAGQDILAPGDQQTLGNWFDHVVEKATDDEGQSYIKAVGWWSTLDAVKQGLGSFGGNNVEVNAGGNIRNLSVWSPTARQLVNTTTTTVGEAIDGADPVVTTTVQQQARVLNGGDVTVRAGGDVLGGQLFLGRGQGLIQAGGSVGLGSVLGDAEAKASEARKLVLGQMSGAWSVQAGKDLTLGLAINPTAAPLAVRQGATTNSAIGAFVTLDETSQLSLSALVGDVLWDTDYLNRHYRLVGDALSAGNDKLNYSTYQNAFKPLSNIVAPVVRVAAHQGNVSFGAYGGNEPGLYLAPLATGDLSILARGRLSLAQISLAGSAQAQAWPSLSRPADSGTTDSGLRQLTGLGATLGNNRISGYAGDALADPGNATPVLDTLHQGDAVPVRIHADGDIVSAGQISRLVVNKPLEMTAGRDILLQDLAVSAQHFEQADTSLIAAGRNILGSIENTGLLRLHGPGNLRVEAGRQVDLGNALGIESVGNLINQALPTAGGAITVKAGWAPEVKVDEFVATYLTTEADRQRLVDEVRQALRLSEPVSFEQAVAYWRGMSTDSQTRFAQQVLLERFKAAYPSMASGVSGDTSSLAQQRAKDELIFAEVDRLGQQALAIADSENPAENARRKAQRDAIWAQVDQMLNLAGLAAGFEFKGDIKLTGSKIHTAGSGSFEQGGINLMTPGGQQVVGLSALSDKDRSTAVASKRGLITKDGGSIRSFAAQDFQVNAQKAFVVGAGDLMVFSRTGSIDSGRGSNTDVSAYVPRLRRLASGEVVAVTDNGTTGSGIGVLRNAQGVAEGDVKLYAPRGEIKALDAFIRNQGSGKVAVVGDVKGGDNLQGNVSGFSSGSNLGFALSVNTGLKEDTAAGNLQEVSAGQDAKKKASSLVTVDVLSLGDGEAPAAGPVSTDPAAECADESCKKERR